MTNFFPFIGDVKFDFFECTYDGDDNLIEVHYRRGGAGGDIVAHLVMTYDGDGNLLTATKTVL